MVQPLEVGWSEAPPPISDIGLQALNVEANKKIYISTAAPLWDRIFLKIIFHFKFNAPTHRINCFPLHVPCIFHIHHSLYANRSGQKNKQKTVHIED